MQADLGDRLSCYTCNCEASTAMKVHTAFSDDSNVSMQRMLSEMKPMLLPALSCIDVVMGMQKKYSPFVKRHCIISLLSMVCRLDMAGLERVKLLLADCIL